MRIFIFFVKERNSLCIVKSRKINRFLGIEFIYEDSVCMNSIYKEEFSDSLNYIKSIQYLKIVLP